MEEYKESMKGIFTTSVSRRTLDEAPLAYKPMEDIVRHIGDTVAILKHVRPLYNFKSA
jgi:tRNA-splicing ligase RtcB